MAAALAFADVQTITRPRDLPAQDLLNMKGVDRPTPLTHVTIEQQLNSQLPLDALFADEHGQTVQLGNYFGKRPVVLALVYYECPMLCTQILNGMVRAAKVLTFTPGKDYDVVAISFDARETPTDAAEKKAVYMKDYGHPGDGGWLALSDRRSGFDQAGDRGGGIPLHVGCPHRAVRARQRDLCADAGGQAFKYFYGIEYSPKDMRLGLVEASQNKIGNAGRSDSCCSATTSIRTRRNTRRLQWVSCAWPERLRVLMLGGFVFIMLRRESRQKGNRAA